MTALTPKELVQRAIARGEITLLPPPEAKATFGGPWTPERRAKAREMQLRNWTPERRQAQSERQRRLWRKMSAAQREQRRQQIKAGEQRRRRELPEKGQAA